MAEGESVQSDSRGILDPWLLRQRVRLSRFPARGRLAGVVDRFWTVRWELPEGVVHTQQVLTHPAANLSVGHADGRSGHRPDAPIEARLYGVARGVSTRVLVGRGWTVAAMTTPGGLGAFIDDSAAELTDRVVALGEAVGVDEEALLEEAGAAPDDASRVVVLAGALERVLRPHRVEAARRVAEVAHLAETDRSLRRLGDLSERTGIGPRTLQRTFLEYAGVPPTWVLRRYRLLDAAEAVRDGAEVSWADLAAELGYADQAHLSRDFRAAIGRTPAAYARAQTA